MFFTWWVGDWGVEAAEVDQSVGAEEEVGDDGSDGVQLSWSRERTGGATMVHFYLSCNP